MTWGPFSLEGKVALVTGGGAGIGLGIVKKLKEAGADVVALVRSPSSVKRLGAETRDVGVVICDLGSADATKKAFAEAKSVHGRIDILVNNAAMFPSVDFLSFVPEIFDEFYAVNLRAPALLIQAFARSCKTAKRGGKIVNIASMATDMTSPGITLYGATKGGLVSMTRQLARELAPLDIAVNAISPGLIFHDNLMKSDMPQDVLEVTEKMIADLIARSNPGRPGTSEEIANAVVFLASAASDFVSGHTLMVDGGVTLN